MRPAPTGNAADRSATTARALGAHLPPLLVAAERVASTVTQGLHGRRRVGHGDSFWQFRPLLPGENAQRVDWRRSARTPGTHFVRQTEWEAAQSIVLWRAGTATMQWRSLPSLPRKLERADLLLLALASILLRAGERVRLLDAAASFASGLAGLPRLAARLEEGLPPTPDLARVPRHACVVLIGDWLEPIPTIRAMLAGLPEREATGHLLQVLDPAEVEFPYSGRVRFRGFWPGAPTALIGRAEGVRDAYAGRLSEQQDQVRSLCHGLGLTFSQHRTDHPAVGALLSLYSALSTWAERR